MSERWIEPDAAAEGEEPRRHTVGNVPVADLRVLVLAPPGTDVSLTAATLAEGRIASQTCRDIEELCTEIAAGAGAVLLSDEALDSAAVVRLSELLSGQPGWSDLPVLLLTRGGSESPVAAEALRVFGNVMLLERPVRVQTLVAAVQTILRGRRRQYQIREHVAERERTAQALRESEERLRVAVSAAEMGTWRTDIHTGMHARDASLNRILGLGPAETVSTLDEFLQRVHPDDRDGVRSALRRAFGEQVSYFAEYRVLRPDGASRWLRDRGKVIHTEDGRFFMTGAAADVTERKSAEEGLKALNETLEQRVAERTAVAERQAAQLRKLAAELTHAEQQERRRLAQILHDDLQQLLVAAKLTLEAIRARAPDPKFRESIQQVQELLSQSVEASRSLTVALSPPILYDGGLLPALDWLARWIEDKHGLRVEVHTDPAAEPDTEETQVFLFQAVRELLFNVVKHGHVDHAEVLAEPAGDDHVCITVKDGGRGFDPAILDEAIASPGFGLFSIRERLENLGGRFEVETAPGNGVRIQLFAPLEHGAIEDETSSAHEENGAGAPQIPAAAPTGIATEADGKIRVLLADDHRILRMGLASLLRNEPDIEIVGEATDGRMALEMSRDLHPDVIIMDITMPRMNGIDATRHIMHEQPDVRVIGMSMHEQDDMATAMRHAGAVAYLTKGCPSDELCRIIRGAHAQHACSGE